MTFQRSLPENEVLRRFGGALLPATLGETLAATFSDPILQPTFDLLTTQEELSRAAGEPRRIIGPGGAEVVVEPNEELLSPLVSPEALNEEFGHLGLKFDRPTRRQVAEILAREKREEIIRADVIARGPHGVLATGARFSAAVVAAALDPVNVAAAFVPGVREARLAGLAARVGVRLGRTGARLTTGFVSGALGNAAVEPLTFALSRQQQRDYGMADALVNIGLGGLIGGGFHAIGGTIGDFLQARSPEAREAAIRTSVAQLAQGRQVEVEPVFRADQPTRPDDGATFVTRLQRALSRPGGAFDPGSVRAGDARPAEEIAAYVRDVIKPSGGKASGERFLFDLGRAPSSVTARVAALRPDFPSSPGQSLRISSDVLAKLYRRNAREADRLLASLPDLLGRPREVLPDHQRADRVLLADRFETASGKGKNKNKNKNKVAVIEAAVSRDGIEVVSVHVSPDRTLEKARALLRKLLGRDGGGAGGATFPSFGGPQVGTPAAADFPTVGLTTSDNVGGRGEPGNLREVVRRETLPERDTAADFEASAQADAEIARVGDDSGATAAQNEAEFLQARIDELLSQELLSETEMRELDEIRAVVERAEAFGRAARQAAVCLAR